jgi:hypothetical protein
MSGSEASLINRGWINGIKLHWLNRLNNWRLAIGVAHDITFTEYAF